MDPKNAHLFTHIDLDGIGCAIPFLAAGGQLRNVHFCEYDEIDEELRRHLESGEPGGIIISDLRANDELNAELDRRYRSGSEVMMRDHHATALHLNQFEWAQIDSSRCATWWMWEAMGANPRLREMAFIIDDYDRWVHSDPRAQQLQTLFGELGRDRMIARLLQRPEIEFSDSEQLILELAERRRQRSISAAIERMEVRSIGGYQVGITLATEYFSELSERARQELSLDIVCLIDPYKQRGHLRARPGVVVNGIASMLGGGGHPQAAGFGATGDGCYIFEPLNQVPGSVAEKLERAFERSLEGAALG